MQLIIAYEHEKNKFFFKGAGMNTREILFPEILQSSSSQETEMMLCGFTEQFPIINEGK